MQVLEAAKAVDAISKEAVHSCRQSEVMVTPKGVSNL